MRKILSKILEWASMPFGYLIGFMIGLMWWLKLASAQNPWMRKPFGCISVPILAAWFAIFWVWQLVGRIQTRIRGKKP